MTVKNRAATEPDEAAGRLRSEHQGRAERDLRDPGREHRRVVVQGDEVGHLRRELLAREGEVARAGDDERQAEQDAEEGTHASMVPVPAIGCSRCATWTCSKRGSLARHAVHGSTLLVTTNRRQPRRPSRCCSDRSRSTSASSCPRSPPCGTCCSVRCSGSSCVLSGWRAIRDRRASARGAGVVVDRHRDRDRRARHARLAGARDRDRGRVPAAVLVAVRQPLTRGHQPSVPGAPLNGPTMSAVIQPP